MNNPTASFPPHLPDTGPEERQKVGHHLCKSNVLLVGGSRLLQESVTQLLKDTPYCVRRFVPNMDQAIRALRKNSSDFRMLIIQLVDVNEAQFFSNLSQLKALAGECPVVLLAWPQKGLNFLAESFEIGIDGYFESDLSWEKFKQGLDLVRGGQRIFPPRLKCLKHKGRSVVPNTEANPTPEAWRGLPGKELSVRELEVLRLVASGCPNKVIAHKLDIVEATVKVHIKNVLRKVGASNRTQAAIWAIENELTLNNNNSPELHC